MQCRICGANEVSEAGEVEYYSGFAWTIFDCHACFCRFTKHDESIYDWLHSTPSSIYGLYRELGESARRLFQERDLVGLRKELSEIAKYKFVIESLESYPRSSRLLEIGCARGFLTSYFILAGYDIVGTDISPAAIAWAGESFGNHFTLADSTLSQERAPYDVIYHVGTIGCISDPMGLTRRLLKLLKPGGQLLFNAPNADSCYLKGQLWTDAAPPPDVVTLFRPGFWRRHFSNTASVVEEVETCSADQSFAIALKKRFGRAWSKPIPFALGTSAGYYQGGPLENGASKGKLWYLLEQTGRRVGYLTRLSRLAARRPTAFGLFVRMTKKTA